MNFLPSLLPTIEHFHMAGYWLALLAAFFETTVGVGLIIPGSMIVLLMGSLAGQNYFDLGDLLWFAIIGAILGDNLNYFLGRRYGTRILAKGIWFIKPKHIKKGEDFFINHGSKSVFLGRFIPSIKELVPLIAGTFGMKRRTFLLWNILGAVGWSLLWILPGYFFTKSVVVAQMWLTRASYFLVVVVLVFIVFYIVKVLLIKKGKQLLIFLYSIGKSIKHSIRENNEVQELIKRHQKLSHFIKRRLDKNNFFGLPLTLFGIAFIYVLLGLGGIVEDIIYSDIIVTTDIRVENLLLIFRNSAMIKIFFWLTLLGKSEVIFVATLVSILIFWLWQKKVYIVPLLVSIAGSEIFTTIGKLVFHRARPASAIYLENSFSFPSGHATIAVAFYGFIVYFLLKNVKQWSKKINIFFAGFILVGLIGFSRLYLGVHYVSDVWAGYLVGTTWLIIAISLTEYYIHKQTSNILIQKKAKNIIITIGLLMIGVSTYFFYVFNNKIPLAQPVPVEKNIVVTDILGTFTSDKMAYTETLFGSKQQPLSFIIIAKDDQQFIHLFEQANWILADAVHLQSVMRLAQDVITKKSYPEAPMTPDFWNSDVHNFGFEKSTDTNSVKTRHHARFWKTNYTTASGEVIYVGTASFDSGLKWWVTHHISPDIDTEREFLFTDLQATGKVVSFVKKQLVSPVLGTNFSGDPFFTDGLVYFLTIKK